MPNIHIETEVTFMNEMIRDIKSGRIAPAAFQRPFVWAEKDVLALWNSIVNGYPLGALLLWRPRNLDVNAKKSLGPITLNPDKYASLILDGQNRLVTMAWSITKPDVDVPQDTPGREIFRNGRVLVADPYTKTVRFMKKADIQGMIMPVHHLDGTTSSFFREHWKTEEDNEHMEWIEGVASRFRESRIVKTSIINATSDEAREAFLHISRTGVPMSQEDFDNAVAYQG